MIIGIDEAGRGALAGPVVAGAVLMGDVECVMQDDGIFALIKDSKKLTDAQRRQVYAWLKANTYWGVGVVSAQKIDEIGIKLATEKAMNEALRQVIRPLGTQGDSSGRGSPPPTPPSGMEEIRLLIDGRDGFRFPYRSEDIVKGDEKILEISAASVIAKVTRDDYMMKLDAQYPGFGFSGHKGYGAAEHYKQLDQGIYCPQHRKSYDPLKTWLNQGRLF